MFDDAITEFVVDYEFDVPNCTAQARAQTRVIFGQPLAIDAEGNFEFDLLGSSPPSLAASGSLEATGDASGSAEISVAGPDCDAVTFPLTWTAQHVVCGDGKLQWPETCEPDASGAAPCSTVCQLSPINESEPNDDFAQTGEAVTADAIWSGSLPSLDVDLFAIRNPYPGPIAITLETHGETMGVCEANGKLVDTRIDLFNRQGDLLSGDEDGARHYFCSALSHTLAGGQLGFIRVSSGAEIVPAYQLHVHFQDR